jgi:hypothetical protein
MHAIVQNQRGTINDDLTETEDQPADAILAKTMPVIERIAISAPIEALPPQLVHLKEPCREPDG